MKEHKIDEQYSIFYSNVFLGMLNVELHDFDNLTFFKDRITVDEFNLMKLKPEQFI